MINRFSLWPVLLIVFSTCAYGSTKNIILIGYPRSMTTVLERYFINRGDFDVCHEPIRIYVWEMSKGRSQDANNKHADQALKNIHFKKRDKPYFIKDFAYFLADVQFMNELMQDDKVQIVFLIRDPEQAVISYYKTAVQSNMSNAFGYTLEEMQYSKMLKLMQQMHRLKRKIITIDADDLTADPRKVLHNLCAQLNIPFKANDLHWQSSENIWNKSEEVWQKHVLKSKQIEKHTNTHKISDIQYPHRAGIEKLIQKNKEIYMQLKNFK